MRRLFVLVIGFFLIPAGAASAQDTSRSEFSAGWRYYHARLNNLVRPIQLRAPNSNYPKGWYADAAVNLSPKFAIVGEAGGTYFSDDVSSTSGTVVIKESLDIKFHTFMGGARVRAPQIPWFVPFGQVLFGGEHDTSSDERTLTIFQTIQRNRQDLSSSNAALALDSGATIAFGRIGVRASTGYVRLFSVADADAFRFSLGGAFRF